MKMENPPPDSSGIPAFREGKVKRLEIWLREHHQTLDESWGYSDSHNDLPLLERVTHPVVVTPDSVLRKIAQDRYWKIYDSRSFATGKFNLRGTDLE